jgi:hypothetical protein
MGRIAALVFLAAVLSAAALTPDEAQAGRYTFTATADTHVNQAYPNKNYGAGKRTYVNGGSEPDAETYLRFNVSGLSGTVTGATLRLYVASGTANGPAVYRTGASWSEMNMTWNSRPAANADPRDDKGAIASGVWVDWDVTPWVTGGGSYGFALKTTSRDGITASSRESTRKPELVVTTAEPVLTPPPPPPPACAAGQFLATYFNNTDLAEPAALVRCEAAPLSHRLGSNSPAAGVNADNFSARWTGTFEFQAGTYDFSFLHDDGIRVFIDGVLVADHWRNIACPCPNARTFSRSLTAGSHAVKVEFQELLGSADVTLSWALRPPPPLPGSEPSPIAGYGYAKVFEDEFTVLDRSVWCDRQWWEGAAPANSQYVQDGALHLVSRRSQGYANTTVSSEPCGQANPKSFKQGYFEARMRWTGGDGSWPAFWMLSYAHANNTNWPDPFCPNPDCLSAELDVMEGQGGTPFDFYGTIHRNSCGCYGVANQQNANNWHPQEFRLADNWHTYSALWTATTVSWYVDDVFSHSAPVWDSFNQPMFLILQMWTGGWVSGTNSSTPNELHTEIDWVRVWQR